MSLTTTVSDRAWDAVATEYQVVKRVANAMSHQIRVSRIFAVVGDRVWFHSTDQAGESQWLAVENGDLIATDTENLV
jgi:hypothetical protein